MAFFPQKVLKYLENHYQWQKYSTEVTAIVEIWLDRWFDFAKQTTAEGISNPAVSLPLGQTA